MVLKKNLPFLIVMGALVVALIAALVWLQGSVSATNKIVAEKEDVQTKALQVRKEVPTTDHLEDVKKQKQEAEAAYEQLRETLLTWWDREVYDAEESPRQPLLFMGKLQGLSEKLLAFATEQGVVLAQGVENMGFSELATSTPPREVTTEMLKQRSAMRDILMLLINNKVGSIDSVAWLGPQDGGKLYDKYAVQVTFTCKYPALAKFQTDLVQKSKVLVGTHGEYPRNYLVVEKLAYSAEDRKVAALDTDRSRASTTGTGTRGTTGAAGNIRNTTTGTAGNRRTEANDPYRAMYERMRGRTGGRSTQPRSNTTTSRTDSRTVSRTDTNVPREGREPNYNILTVSMTISMVDFKEAITGEIPGTEDEKKPGKDNKARTASNQ